MKYLNIIITYTEPPRHWWKSVMPLFLSEVDGRFRSPSSQPVTRRSITWISETKSWVTMLYINLMQRGSCCGLGDLKCIQTCNISRVDTHCKHKLHCTECPFTGEDVYRSFIFNLLSPIFNRERMIYEIQINKWINPRIDSCFHSFFCVCPVTLGHYIQRRKIKQGLEMTLMWLKESVGIISTWQKFNFGL